MIKPIRSAAAASRSSRSTPVSRLSTPWLSATPPSISGTPAKPVVVILRQLAPDLGEVLPVKIVRERKRSNRPENTTRTPRCRPAAAGQRFPAESSCGRCRCGPARAALLEPKRQPGREIGALKAISRSEVSAWRISPKAARWKNSRRTLRPGPRSGSASAGAARRSPAGSGPPCRSVADGAFVEFAIEGRKTLPAAWDKAKAAPTIVPPETVDRATTRSNRPTACNVSNSPRWKAAAR